jgi:ribosomal-protein-alanine N-acetyltransferase
MKSMPGSCRRRWDAEPAFLPGRQRLAFRQALLSNYLVRFLLRSYRPADFDRLWQIDQSCFAPGIAYSQMELTGFILRRNAITVVAELAPDHNHSTNQDGGMPQAGDIAGFAIAQPSRNLGRILTLDVTAEARRAGLGTQLMKACEQGLKQRGCTEVYLETAVDNEAALRLYYQLGYQILRTLPEYYRTHGLDAFLMGKAL